MSLYICDPDHVVLWLKLFLNAVVEKAQRIKEAKEEAKKEVEKYKQERERLFQEQMKKVYLHWCHKTFQLFVTSGSVYISANL